MNRKASTAAAGIPGVGNVTAAALRNRLLRLRLPLRGRAAARYGRAGADGDKLAALRAT
jgi:septal ring factor EnvC (AmiA/AmiB activator)